MDISVNTAAFGKELDLCQRIVSRKPTIPILSHVKLSANGDGRIELAATDLDLALVTTCEAVIAQAGDVAVPARTIYEIVKSLNAQETHLASTKTSTDVHAGSYKGKLQAPDVADYPAIPVPTGAAVMLPRAALRDLIGRVRYAVTAEDTRYFLQGALLVLATDRMTLVATDGHRLTKASVPITDGIEASVIVPKRTLDALSDLLDAEDETVEFVQGEQHLFFAVGKRRLISRMIDAKFPAYDRVIPAGHILTFTVATDALVSAIRRVLLTAPHSYIVSCAFLGDGVRVKSATADIGEAIEQVAGVFAGGEPITIGLNGRYLLDALETVGAEQIVWRLKDETAPVRIEPIGGPIEHVSVIMPMRT